MKKRPDKTIRSRQEDEYLLPSDQAIVLQRIANLILGSLAPRHIVDIRTSSDAEVGRFLKSVLREALYEHRKKARKPAV